MLPKALAIALCLSLSACAVKPIGSAPQAIAERVEIPSRWMFAAAENAEARQQAWWQQFGSAELNALISQAMLGNADLQAAALTWRKARLAVDSAALAQSPAFSGSLGANAARNYDSNSNSSSFSTGLSAAYQLDLWDKLGAATQTAAWNAEAGAQDLLAARLSLQGEVVNAWLALLYAQARLELNQAQQQYQQQTYQLVEAQLSQGAASRLDLDNARQALHTLALSRRSLEAQIEQAQAALTVLLGRPPAPFISAEGLSSIELPPLAPNLPAALLQQRPDLRAAQYRLQAALGNIAVAERDFYPAVNLNAGFNSGGSLLRELLQNPVASLAGSISLPFLQQREVNLALQNAELDYQADLAAFEQSLYRAFADVETALSGLRESEDSAARLAQQLAEARQIEALTRIRYQAGADALKTLLDAQQARRDVEAAQLDNRYQYLSRRVSLYLALGGSDDAAVLQTAVQP